MIYHLNLKMIKKNPLPRNKNEILSRLDYLEVKKETLVREGCLSGALALGSQIEMLLWAYNMQPNRL